MSLLMNEDFTLYNLRLGYLNNNHDGVGERLISLNTGVLNEPAFRAAGWTPDTAAVKRCYSPPIPTTGAAEYFTRPSRAKGGGVLLADHGEEQGGMISGHRGSQDTISTNVFSEKERRRRKQREKMEEDDSSDLSDDSEEDTAAQSVKFAKMPIRAARSSNPSPPDNVGVRDQTSEGNLSGPDARPRIGNAAKGDPPRFPTGRPRRDTTTSSEMSSDNDISNNSTFKRKLPSRPQKSVMLADKIAEEEAEDSDLEDEEEDEEEDVEVAEASDLDDEFEDDDVAAPPSALLVESGTTSSPPHKDISMPPAITPTSSSPRKTKEQLPKLPKLPSGRPMSMLPASSLLTMALKGNGGGSDGEKAFQRYAELSGKGETNPLWIKIYYSFAEKSSKPVEVPIRRAKAADAGPPAVSDLIGLALFRYDEEEMKPALKSSDKRLKRWELRMVDDGEIEMDFPALDRAKLVTDFTSNNNRPPQRRMRDKPWDEFGLVRAEEADDDDEDEEGGTALADIGQTAAASTTTLTTVRSTVPEHTAPPAPPSLIPNRNPITGPSFALANTAARKDSSALLDLPQAPVATSTPRTGAAKTVEIHFTDPQSFQTTLLPVPTTSDTYIAEIFDIACARLRLDKALYVLKVRGTQTVAPSDRTIEALGSNLHLDLVRRRFGAVGDFGLGLSGSPSSNSPNAPLELVPNTPPTAKEGKRKKGFGVLHPTTAQQPTLHATTSLMNLANSTMPGRRYNVQRKLPLSFSGSHPRTLVITPEFLQILPSTTEESGPATGKVTNIHMSSIVGVKVSRKHQKMVRVLVYREKETKRYDFECVSHDEAENIVRDVRVGTGTES
ncbi:hypothetical protein WHR41_02615 [Cladosporium halotolerans]|uniref:Stress activated MAP kinase interacting protein Sin1 n=1 Tax=Cladosporium halotolerans TaxID=1052096 RepID=A0AB34KZF1_9PEZI